MDGDQPPVTPGVERTNTIAITQLPKAFFHPLILDVLRSHFESYGEINRWIPLPGFGGRIMVVYYDEQHAEMAKLECDPIILENLSRAEADGHIHHSTEPVTLRVYRADPNPLLPAENTPYTVPEQNYLRPPATDKNFLISPPGSPPVGWEQIREDPPNATPLADDLMDALRKLQLTERRRRGSGSSSGSEGRFEVLLEPEEGEEGVRVCVEDCDGPMDYTERDEEWVYGETMPSRDRWQILPTAMPPMQAMVM